MGEAFFTSLLKSNVLEDKVDEMVLDLYELTEDERNIVKGAA